MRRSIPGGDPLSVGPQPLLNEKDRASLDKMLDRIQEKLVGYITTNIPRDANYLFSRGYSIDDMQICGFGEGTRVEIRPGIRHSAMRLWFGRILVYLHVRNLTVHDYSRIWCPDFDTYRLITFLKIFEQQDEPRKILGRKDVCA